MGKLARHNPIDKIEAVDTDTLKEALIKDLYHLYLKWM